MKDFVMFYAILLSQVNTQETNDLHKLISQGFNEPLKKYLQQDKSLEIAPDIILPKSQQYEETDNESLISFKGSDNQKYLSEKNTKSSKSNSKSMCHYWCVTSAKKMYCCNDKNAEDLEDHLDVCPVIRKTCLVSDVNLADHSQDGKDPKILDIFEKGPCIISSRDLRHLRLYHQSHKISNGNISAIEIFGTKHKEIVISPRIFGNKENNFGVYKEEDNDQSYVRPFFRALHLALNIGTLTKVVPHVPQITNDPGREHYSDRYKIYDSYLPDDILATNEYESVLLEDYIQASDKEESILLSRIAKHVYDKP